MRLLGHGWSVSKRFNFYFMEKQKQTWRGGVKWCEVWERGQFIDFISPVRSEIMWSIYTSNNFTPHGRYEVNKLTSLPMSDFIAQLVEQRTGNAEVTGSNPVEALIFFFRLLLSNCLNWKIYCDDHSSLSSTTAVQKWIIFIYFT